MKKLLLSISFLLGMTAISYSQTRQNWISKLPEQANGFLLLDYLNYPTVQKWQIDVYQKVMLNGNYISQKISSKTLLGKNYTFIDEIGSGIDLEYVVSGSDGDGRVIANPNGVPIGWTGAGSLTCAWSCVGGNYAYGIEFYSTQDGGTGQYMMVPPYEPIDQPCYYEWVEASYFNTWAQDGVNNAPFRRDIMQNTATITYPYSANPEFLIKINVPSGEYKYDRNGQAINGWVYGVKKYYGQYASNSAMYTSHSTTNDESECGYPISYPIGQINMAISDFNANHTPVIPSLQCQGSGFIHAVGNYGEYASVSDPISNETEPCTGDIYEYIGQNWEEGGIYLLVVYSEPCLDFGSLGTPGNGQGLDWPEELHQMNIVKYEEDDVEPISILREDIFDANDNFIGDENLNLTPGLYQVQYIYSDLSIGTYYFNTDKNISSEVFEKDFITYTAYPVPITNNEFRLNFQATKNLSFIYDLKDSQGNLLESKRYEIRKGQSINDLIKINPTAPAGLLFNKLTFSDGSEINFQTIKN